jgi:hypothetical protein
MEKWIISTAIFGGITCWLCFFWDHMGWGARLLLMCVLLNCSTGRTLALNFLIAYFTTPSSPKNPISLEVWLTEKCKIPSGSRTEKIAEALASPSMEITTPADLEEMQLVDAEEVLTSLKQFDINVSDRSKIRNYLKTLHISTRERSRSRSASPSGRRNDDY